MLLLCLLAGCATTPGVYHYDATGGRYTGWALSTGQLLGVIHGEPKVGDLVTIPTRWVTLKAVVTATHGEAVLVDGRGGTGLPLEHGMSGAAILDSEGHPVAVLQGRILMGKIEASK